MNTKLENYYYSMCRKDSKQLYFLVYVMTKKIFVPMSDMDEHFDIDLGKYHFFNKFIKNIPRKFNQIF